MQNPIEVFARNIDQVIGEANLKDLVQNFRSAGETLDYTYVQKMRKGTTNPSIEKCEQVVRMVQEMPGYSWVELWMFYVPGYFERYNENMLNRSDFTFDYFESFVRELLVTSSRLQFIELSEKQFNQMTELASYIFEKKHGLPAKEPVGFSPADQTRIEA